MDESVRLPQPGTSHHHPHHFALGTGFGVGGLLALASNNSRHPLRDWLFVASSFVVAPASLGLLSALGWPASAWNVLLMVVVAVGWNMIPSRRDRRGARYELERAIQAERLYRLNYRAKLASVCVEGELRTLDGLWDLPERSFAQDAFWYDLTDRWFAANPTRYTSQDQARGRGWLCVCEAVVGHTCQRDEITNLAQAEAALIRIAPARSTSPRRLAPAQERHPQGPGWMSSNPLRRWVLQVTSWPTPPGDGKADHQLRLGVHESLEMIMPDPENPILTCLSGDHALLLLIPLDLAVRELSEYQELRGGEDEIEDNCRPEPRLTTAQWLDQEEPELLAKCGRPDTSTGFTDYEPAPFVAPEDRAAIEDELQRLGYRVLHSAALAFAYLEGLPGLDVGAALLAGCVSPVAGED